MRRFLGFAVLIAVAIPAAGTRAATAHVVDLANGRVDGKQALGQTVGGVTAALGSADFRAGPPSRYRIGWGSQSRFSTEVIFRRNGSVQRAWSIVFERGPVSDPKVGNLLQPSPKLQEAILSKYGTTYTLVRPYICTTEMRCVGEFAARSGPLHLTFGTQPATGTWLTIWK